MLPPAIHLNSALRPLNAVALLGFAFGGSTFKLKFGHRGANQPVKDLETGKVAITAQNHGFAVDPKSSDCPVTGASDESDTVR